MNRTRLSLMLTINLTLVACAAPSLRPDVPPSAAPLAQPTATPQQPSPTNTPPVEAQPAEPPALADEIVDDHGITMLLIPAGDFIMGSEDGFNDELPVHTVTLDAFYMDIYEVTNAAYVDCVEDGACQPPRFTGSRRRYEFYGVPEFDDHPAVYLSWFDADTYCTWRGARLPTEAEWEKAARGEDGRTYAWGNQRPSPTLTNYAGTGLWETAPVGQYPEGISPYGIHDMSGNVYEWVSDWYEQDYYRRSPSSNPTGPVDGAWRITKGGSFWNWDYRLRAANRNNTYLPPDSVHWDGGARCARSP